MLKLNNDIFELSTEHIYLFAWLQDMRRKNEFKTITSITIISGQIQFVKKEYDNKRRIKQLLLELAEHNFLDIQPMKFNYNEGITICFDKLGRTRRNFTKNLSSELLRLTPVQFTLVAYIHRYSKLKGKRISLVEFTDKLKLGTNTVKDNLDLLEQMKIIWINRGKYITLADGSLRQETNQYIIRPYTDWFKTDADLILDGYKQQGII